MRVLLTFVLVVTLVAIMTNETEAQSDSSEQYTYIVERGDSWSIIAEETGLSVAELQRLNPGSVRANGWLLVGEELVIPLPAPEDETEEAGEPVGDEAADDQAGDEEEAADEGETDVEETYLVGAGESWNSIANEFGIPVDELKAANPEAVRADDVLYRGISLVIPRLEESAGEEETADDADDGAADESTEVETQPDDGAADEEAADEDGETVDDSVPDETVGDETADDVAMPEDTASDTETAEDETAADESAEGSVEDSDADASDEPAEPYTVGPGESWNSIARVLAIDPEVLRAANPDIVRPGDVLYAGDEIVVPDAATLAELAGEADGPLQECPATFADYPDALMAVLNSTELDSDADGAEALSAFLSQCGARADNDIVSDDWTGDGINDLIAVFIDPATAGLDQIADLMIFNGTGDGYDASFRARAAGSVDLVASEDINNDEQADVVWTDTTCGDSTCFDTVNVRSWDGTSWRDWTDGTITMAYGNIALEEADEAGQGQEIVVVGGVYGSVGAGPQRSRNEIWGSVEGRPYTLLEQSFSASECLYHTVIDGNRSLLNAEEEGFGAAEAYFTDAISNDSLIKCWVRDDELEELQGFSYFRLAQIAAYQDLPDVAGDLVTVLNDLYPEGIYTELSNAWLDAYTAAGDVNAACVAATDFAEANPETWEALADYGYTNPTFTAEDICPPLGVGQEQATSEVPEGQDTTEGDSATTDSAEPDSAETEAADTEEDSAATDSEAVADEAVADEDVPTDEAAAESETEADTEMVAADEQGMPECPPNVDRFARVLPDAIAAANGDLAAVDAWLASCDAVVEGEQVSSAVDLNADGIDDAIFFPTVVSDLGFGPGGSQGAVLVYHGQEDGTYELVHAPEIYGQPTLLAAEDVNQNESTELAWTVTSCANFCVVEVQMVTWDGEGYVSAIEPGATIAEGRAYFEPLGSGAVGTGQALVLEGGVSGMADGGLSTPHSEVWQSVDGTPYQRVEWIYDRSAPGNDCLGLRLVEADIALQAADELGYGDAIDLYTQALDPTLQACSLFGMPATEELILLQGLASFRLMQAQALNGDADAAQATLLGLQSGQPEGEYTKAASEWASEYVATGDAEAACAAVTSIFEENQDLWQITDHYGYNHPALPAQQICFVP